MSEEDLTKIKSNCLGYNLQAILLYDIIKDRLFLNYLQLIVIEKVLNYAIFNKRNKCYYKSFQLLLYVRGQERVRKSRIIKAIH